MLLVLATFSVLAGGPGAVRKQVEASMLVTGTIDIAPDGSVSGYALDKPEALPDSVIALAAKALPLWRFKPVLVAGNPVLARAKMSLRYVATKAPGDKHLVRIRSAWFGEDAPEPGEWVSSLERRPPQYPLGAMRSGITGTAYVVLRVGRDGKVADAIVERVNLRVVGSDQQMRRGRKMLADASLSALRQWMFSVPKAGPSVDKAYWDVRVPVVYQKQGQKTPSYGEWDAYVPGPYQPAPWVPANRNRGTDALADGGIYPLGAGPELLTRLGADAG